MSHFVGMAGQFLSPFDFKSPEIGNQIFRFAVNLLPPKAGCYSIISTGAHRRFLYASNRDASTRVYRAG